MVICLMMSLLVILGEVINKVVNRARQNKHVLKTGNSGYRARMNMFYKHGAVAIGLE